VNPSIQLPLRLPIHRKSVILISVVAVGQKIADFKIPVVQKIQKVQQFAGLNILDSTGRRYHDYLLFGNPLQAQSLPKKVNL
jgi:hypothetical protein